MRRKTLQAKFRFGVRPSRKNGEPIGFRQLLQNAGSCDPLFALDQAIAIRAQKNRLKIILNLFEGSFYARLLDGVMGKLPIVVVAALVLVVLDLLGSGLDAGEMFHSAC